MGNMAVIYARYSDSKQTEQSIEGQLKVCNKYCEDNGLTIVREPYIDRAQTGKKTDNRKRFKKMLADSKNQQFDTVVVYAIDRFGRNILQSLLNEKSLQDNGVTVISATEQFNNTPSGRMQRNIHMSFAQYYSEELAEKVARGMSINAEKGLSNGGTIPLGYKLEPIDPKNEKSKKKFVINETTAPIVQEIFTKYANGDSIKQICDSLNERGLKSALNAAFNKSSLHTLLKNRKYLGFYIYKGIEIKNDTMQIIDQELFDRVQEKMGVNKKAPARARAKAEYLLTGKLFCGLCKNKKRKDVMLVGHSSNQVSKRGIIFNYYKCKNQGGSGGTCKKKMVHKDTIEDIIVNKCREQLTPQNIRRLAKEAVRVAESYDDRAEIIRLEGLIKEAQKATENQMTSLRACSDDIVRDMIIKDLSKLGAEVKELEKQLKLEKARRYIITEKQLIDTLTKLAEGDVNNITYRKSLIRILINKIYLYDDRATVTFNSSDEEVEITIELFEKIEENLKGKSLCLSSHGVHHENVKPPQKIFERNFFVGA